MECSKKPNACSLSRLFPPEDKAPWEKGHGRLERRRLARVAVSPEEMGFAGCWQIIAVQRDRIQLNKKEAKPTPETAYYVSSLSLEEQSEAAVDKIIRDHWSAIENGTHYRRDMTFGEDACTTTHRAGAEVLASLRNLAIGIYELERERERTSVDTCSSWCEQQTFSKAWTILRR